MRFLITEFASSQLFLKQPIYLDMKKILLLTISCLTGLIVYSQSESKKVSTRIVPSKVSNSKAVFLGKSKRVDELEVAKSTKSQVAKRLKSEHEHEDKEGRRKSNAVLPELEHQGPDPLRALNNHQKGAAALQRSALVNVDGLRSGFGPPHDPTGEAGLRYYIQVINPDFNEPDPKNVGIYNKNGKLVHNFALHQLWPDLNPENSLLLDPIILYDEQLDRWVFIAVALLPQQESAIAIAVSETPDPMGAYFAYVFKTAYLPDFPKLGIWPEHLVITTNEISGAVLTQYFLDKNSLYSGNAQVSMQRIETEGEIFSENGRIVSTPIDIDGNANPTDTRPMVMRLNDASWGDVAADALDLYRFNVDLDNPDATTVEVISMETTPYDGFPCADGASVFGCLVQPDSNAPLLDAQAENIMNVPKYRRFDTHESIVLCFITDVTNGDNLSGIRWMELRKTPGSDWGIYQEGTYAPEDNVNRFMPSIAIDEYGNIGMGFDVVSKDVYAGIRYTGRMADAPLGTMNIEEFQVVDGTGSNFSTRYGDYSHLSVDPVDGRTFWYTSEYVADNNIVKTRITSFKILRDTTDLGITSFINPTPLGNYGTAEPVTIKIENFGSQSAAGFEVGFSLNGTLIDQQLISDTLLPNNSLSYTFPVNIDLSERTNYELEAFVHLASDDNKINDTLNIDVQNRLERDIALWSLNSMQSVCDTNAALSVLIKNEGVETINKVEILLTVDNNLPDTLTWNGALKNGDSAQISIKASIPANNATYLAKMSVFEVNDQDDLNEQNDSTQLTISQNSEDFTPINLTIQLDNFPQETSWQIASDPGSVRDTLIEGGPYPGQTFGFITENICIFSEDCYTFTIVDGFGDGIVNGSYKLMRSDTYTFFDRGGNFGEQASESFCPKDTSCSADAEVLLQNDSLELYQVNIVTKSGNSPFSYSIDGGATFQDGPTFNDITEGAYTYTIRDLNGCMFTNTITIENKLDLSIESEATINSCGSGATLPVNVINAGLLNLNAIEIAIEINGVPSDTFAIEIPEVSGAAAIELDLPAPGNYTIQLHLIKARGMEVTEAVTTTTIVLIDPVLNRVILSLHTDQFALETVWALIPENSSEPIYEGGPYSDDLAFSEIKQEMCLAEGCYTFEILDTRLGDGICCVRGNGSYQIKGDDNFVYTTSDGQFGGGERVDFCVPGDTNCNIKGGAVAIESAPRKWNILFTPANGLAPFRYSIDGGATFQEEAFFEDVASGTYISVIEDARGCRAYLDTVVIDFPAIITNTNDIRGINESDFIIAPNPTQGHFDVSFKHGTIEQSQVKIQVTDARGRLVYEKMMKRRNGIYQAHISLLNFSKGVYQVRVTEGTSTFSRRLIKF